MKSTIMILLIMLVCFIVNPSNADLIVWPTGEGGTGHFYEIYSEPAGITWDDAQADAVSQSGYLVTILSAAENTFVFDNLVNDSQFWRVVGSPFQNQLGDSP